MTQVAAISSNRRRPPLTTLGVRQDTKAEFKKFADERRREQVDVAAAAIKALKLLPPEQQDALIEGREPAALSA